VLTLGSFGAVLIDGEHVSRVHAPKVTKVLDTTGAGDAFVGAFAHLIGAGVHSEAACATACACCIFERERRGTQASFPTVEGVCCTTR